MINCLFEGRKLFKLLFGVTGNITLLAKYGVNYSATYLHFPFIYDKPLEDHIVSLTHVSRSLLNKSSYTVS